MVIESVLLPVIRVLLLVPFLEVRLIAVLFSLTRLESLSLAIDILNEVAEVVHRVKHTVGSFLSYNPADSFLVHDKHLRHLFSDLHEAHCLGRRTTSSLVGSVAPR